MSSSSFEDVDVTNSLLQLVTNAIAAVTQPDYEEAARAVFAYLDELDARLGTHRFLSRGTEPGTEDLALFTLLLRFELAFHDLYKLNRTRIRDFPNLGGYVRDMYQRSPETDLMAMRRLEYAGQDRRNPNGTIPLGLPDLDAPHDRWRFDAAAAREAGIEEAGAGAKAGEFVRGKSAHRRFVGRDVPAESGRYHLIVANNCPWCHRVALTRSMKGLQDVVSMDVLYYRRDPDRGWQFRPDIDGFGPDRLYGVNYVRELYERIGSTESSVPILWDKVEETVVNNESAEIIRMFDDAWPDHGPKLAPPALVAEIDATNAWIWRDINNGAYKAGFSKNQQAYEKAYHRFFAGLERLDAMLAEQQWVCGDVVTEADVRLFPTIFRFDPVYYVRMKLNKTMVRELRHLSRWQDDFWSLPGVEEASNLEHCRLGYFGRTGDNLIPIGPDPIFAPESP